MLNDNSAINKSFVSSQSFFLYFRILDCWSDLATCFDKKGFHCGIQVFIRRKKSHVVALFLCLKDPNCYNLMNPMERKIKS